MQKASAPKQQKKAQKAKKVAKKVTKVAKRTMVAVPKATKIVKIAQLPQQNAPKMTFIAPKFTPTPQFALFKRQARSFSANPQDNYLQDAKAVESRVFDVLGRFDKVNKEKLNSTALFQADLGLDSLDRVEVVLAIEEEFNTEFTDEQSDKFQGVADVVEFIAKKPDVHQRSYKPDDI